MRERSNHRFVNRRGRSGSRIRTRSRPEIDDAVRFLPDAGNFLLRLPVRMREREELPGRRRILFTSKPILSTLRQMLLSVRSEKAERVARTNVLKGRLLLGPKSDTIALI